MIRTLEMERLSPNPRRNPRLIFSALGVFAAAAVAGGWLYYAFRLHDVPPPPGSMPQTIRPVAGVRIAAQSSALPSAGPSDTPSSAPSADASGEPSSPSGNLLERPIFHVPERHHLDDFRDDLKKTVLVELSPAFPELQTVLRDREESSSEPPYRRVLFQLLDAAKQAPADRRPAILFAADLVAQQIRCDIQNKAGCDQLRLDFQRYQLTLKRDELGGIFLYPHDLLWRLWRDYPATDWGERSFVLLLDSGWDTSGTCEKGADQTREVIRQGESFLRERPGSPYRAAVSLLVAEAYASWWSLGNEPAGSDMSAYVDRKQFQEGGEAARMKAVSFFEEVVQLAPNTGFSGFALEVLPPLRDRQILDNYRFYCVYD